MKSLLLSTILISILMMPVLVLAQAPTVTTAPTIKILGDDGILDRVFKLLFNVFMWVAAICFVVAGYFFAFAQGDPEKIKTAQKMIIYAIIGLAIAFLSKAIVWVIASAIGNYS